MASAARADCPAEGCHLEARRRSITTAPQLHLMSMTATVAKLKSNGECKGNGNSNDPVDNNDDNDYNIDNNNGNDNDGGGGQDRSTNMGQLWRSERRWR